MNIHNEVYDDRRWGDSWWYRRLIKRIYKHGVSDHSDADMWRVMAIFLWRLGVEPRE